MRRFLTLFVLIPLAAVIVMLSVANREPVTLIIDPFGNPPAYVLSAPIYLILFVAFAAGAIAGGLAVWMRQSHWRRAARVERGRASDLQGEVERLRQRAQTAPPMPVLPAGPNSRDAA